MILHYNYVTLHLHVHLHYHVHYIDYSAIHYITWIVTRKVTLFVALNHVTYTTYITYLTSSTCSQRARRLESKKTTDASLVSRDDQRSCHGGFPQVSENWWKKWWKIGQKHGKKLGNISKSTPVRLCCSGIGLYCYLSREAIRSGDENKQTWGKRGYVLNRS